MAPDLEIQAREPTRRGLPRAAGGSLPERNGVIEERFDSLARALAGASRRAGIRLLAGVGIALLPLGRWSSPGASARQTGINQTGWGFGPGESCVSNARCDNSYPVLGLLVCGDTGYVSGPYGGELHNCRYDGGACGDR